MQKWTEGHKKVRNALQKRNALSIQFAAHPTLESDLNEPLVRLSLELLAEDFRVVADIDRQRVQEVDVVNAGGGVPLWKLAQFRLKAMLSVLSVTRCSGQGSTMSTTLNNPAMAEAYRVAALNGYNRLF